MTDDDNDPDVFASLGIGAMDDVHAAMLMSRFDEIGRRMSEDRIDSNDSRRRIHEKLEDQSKVLTTLDGRVQKLEKAVEGAAPTLAEFTTYKEQVRGAGRLGRVLWGIGGFVLAAGVALSTVWSHVAAWLQTLITSPR